MKWRELFEGLLHPATGDEFQQWEPTLQRTRQLLEDRDFRTLTDLIREHRHSELLTRGIGLEMMARLPQLLTSPDAAARHEVLQLMDALRRTAGTRMVVSGVPVSTVAQILGHTDMESTKRYISLDTERLRECCLDLGMMHTRKEGLS